MEMFNLFAKQINSKLTDMLVSVASSFVRYIAHKLPRKEIKIDYNTPHQDHVPADPSKTIITVDFKNILI